MAKSFLFIAAVVMSLYCIKIAALMTSCEDHDLINSLHMKDSVGDSVHGYLQEHENLQIESYSKEDKKEKRKVDSTSSAGTDKSHANHNKYADMEFKNFCSGGVSPPLYIQKKLKCRYVDHGIPFLKIAPFKEEEAYLDPRIVLYHDVIYEDEMEDFKTLAEPKLQSAKVRNADIGKMVVYAGRIAKNAYLENDENEYVKHLRHRVQLMTGLTVNTAERVHIAYYTIGGMYTPHLDAVHKKDKNSLKEFGTGNRIATVLFYMNDVARGGATVFPSLNLTVRPKKGSAVFWYNLKRNGESETQVLHGACPVLSGTKWISTIWIHEHGQEFRRPCTLLEDE